jgi:hypothetical protein
MRVQDIIIGFAERVGDALEDSQIPQNLLFAQTCYDSGSDAQIVSTMSVSEGAPPAALVFTLRRA